MEREYVDQINCAIDYIEANLRQTISMERVAAEAGYSRFYFGRLFRATVGETPGSYVRKRRLSEAAHELVTSKRRILDIALDYQFQSQAAFTRSFKRLFGINPGDYRRKRQLMGVAPRARLSYEKPVHLNGGISMEPRIVEKGPIKLIGMVTYGDNAKGKIPQLWERFMPKIELVQNRINPQIAYGVEFYPDEFPDVWQFYYMAAVEVDSLDDIAIQMVGKSLPANTYAVFTHRGPINKLKLTFEYIYRTWLPKSGYQQAAAYDFECYDERYRDDDEASEIDIHMPITR